MALIFFSDIPWAALHQRPQHLAASLAASTPVLWVEPATMGHRPSFSPVVLGRNLHGVSLPFFPYNARNRVIRRITGILSRISLLRTLLARVQRRLIMRALRTLGLDREQPVCVVQNIQALCLVTHLDPSTILYDCIDNPFGFVEFPSHVHRDWRTLLERADVLVATSPNLRDLIRSRVTKPVQIVSNGVDYDRFAAASHDRPTDLPSSGVPVIGYVGSVYSWVDFDLLHFLCVHAPDLHLVVIGQDHPESREALRRLSTLPNFSFLGVRPYAVVPSYLHTFDVGIIPFRRSPLTAGVNPVKLYEYSAAGLPIVTTDFSDDLAVFRPILDVCRTPEDFVASIRSGIPLRHDPHHIATVQSFARAHDWQDKGREIRLLLQENRPHPLRTVTS
jgi:glycosyltransferase involved in cell wall biosynthesis